MLRVVAIISNVVLLSLIAWLMVSKGMPRGEELPFILTMVAAPVFSLIALMAQGPLKAPELLTLELEARKAKLRKQIAESGGNATRVP